MKQLEELLDEGYYVEYNELEGEEDATNDMENTSNEMNEDLKKTFTNYL